MSNPERPPRSAARRDEAEAAFAPIAGARRTFLDSNASSTGSRWSAALRSGLRSQGRAAAGGFPGTMNEARAEVHRMLPPALSAAKMSALLPEEREWSARVAYACARKDWLDNVEREEDE